MFGLVYHRAMASITLGSVQRQPGHQSLLIFRLRYRSGLVIGHRSNFESTEYSSQDNTKYSPNILLRHSHNIA